MTDRHQANRGRNLLIFLGIAMILGATLTGLWFLGILPRGPSSLVSELGHARNDILVIVNSDDLALHPDQTDATIVAITNGAITSASVMVPCPDFPRLIEIWKQQPELDFGIHLTLTCEWGPRYPWSPLLPRSQVPSLYAPNGLMWPDIPALKAHANPKEAYQEMKAQIEAIREAGLYPTHMDAHMGCYRATPELLDAAVRLSRAYALPLRVSQHTRDQFPWLKNDPSELRRRGFVFPDSFSGYYMLDPHAEGGEARRQAYREALRSLGPGVHEMVVHIAHSTPSLIRAIGPEHAARRQADGNIWRGPEMKRFAAREGITLIGFRRLQELQAQKLPPTHASRSGAKPASGRPGNET